MSPRPVPTLSVIPVAREGFWDVLVPSLPWPGQACGDSSRGLGKAKLPKFKSGLQCHLGGWVSSRLCLLCPSGQCLQPTAPRESPRQTKPVAEPYLSLLACRPGVMCPGLSVFIASICAVLWARWPAASAPRLGATIPSRPSLDHPGQPWDQACTARAVPSARTPPYPTLRRSGLGLECTGSCP